ncbi:unnamed protein product [Urochloa humidicola]
MARVEAVVVCLLVLASPWTSPPPCLGSTRRRLRARMVLVVGLALLVLGALPNRKHKLAECGVMPRHRFLSIGGILCFVHALFCVVYYASASAAKREERRGGA